MIDEAEALLRAQARWSGTIGRDRLEAVVESAHATDGVAARRLGGDRAVDVAPTTMTGSPVVA